MSQEEAEVAEPICVDDKNWSLVVFIMAANSKCFNDHKCTRVIDFKDSKLHCFC